MNESLKAAAVAAGVHKPVSTHVVRKSVGTLMGRDNPKLAQLQLGISEAVFNAHYNQPLLEDRLARRDLVPGGARPAVVAPAPVGKRPPDPRPQALVDERDETGYR